MLSLAPSAKKAHSHLANQLLALVAEPASFETYFRMTIRDGPSARSFVARLARSFCRHWGARGLFEKEFEKELSFSTDKKLAYYRSTVIQYRTRVACDRHPLPAKKVG